MKLLALCKSCDGIRVMLRESRTDHISFITDNIGDAQEVTLVIGLSVAVALGYVIWSCTKTGCRRPRE